MKKSILMVVVALLTLGTVSTAQNLSDPINPDPNVKVGKLPNGMTYYIRENKKPEKRIEFRLAVNAGSNQEDKGQEGLAHFTEHMAFNGTEHFPNNTLVSELQTIGVAFGYDLNAYTFFDETVYEVRLPSDDPKFLPMGLTILYDWACALSFDPEEIEQERGIIVEEYRMGLGADDRMQKKWLPVLFKNSKYAERLPIGLLDVIKTFKHETIKSFYKDWYRPDLQAIIIVGDINAAEVEQKIKEMFGKIPVAKNPREKIYYSVENNVEPLISVCTDKEAMGSQVQMIRKFSHVPMKTVEDFRMSIVHALYGTMYNARLSEMQQDTKTPFLGAYAGYGRYIGMMDAYSLNASAKENQIDKTIEALMIEDFRILQYGFLETELKRAKEEILNRYEIASKEVDKTESARFADEYVSNFLWKEPIPGAKREYNYAKKFLEGITLNEVNALAQKWVISNNLVVVVTAPDKPDVKVPTEAEVLAIIKNKALANVTPYIDTYKDQEIVEAELTPGTITATKELTEIEATELTLSNGIKVVLKKTDFKNDEILFNARSKGGLSLYPEKDLASAMFASDFVDRAGIGELNYTSLEKKLKGKKLGLVPYITDYTEGFQGSSTPKDLETFFQYIYAFFETPRHDPNVYDLVINETLEQMKMIKANPMYQFFGKFMETVSQHDPYQSNMLTYTEDFVKSADYERAFQIYKERFANPADFTFFFTGNFDEKIILDYIKKYLGSLPATNVKEDFKNVFKGFPAKTLQENIYAGADEQSWVGLALNKEYTWNLENNMLLSVINEALQIELIEVIREKMSGVYSPMLQLEYSKFPTSEYNMMVMFSCAPDNTDNLANAVFKILKDFQKQGPKKETLVKVKETLIRANQTDVKKNNFWLSYMAGKYMNGDDLNAINTYEQRVNDVKMESIVNFLKANMDTDHFVRVTLYPEAMKK